MYIRAMLAVPFLAALLAAPQSAEAIIIVIVGQNGDTVIVRNSGAQPPGPQLIDYEIDWLTTDSNPVLECSEGWLDLVVVNFTIGGGHKHGDLALVTESPLAHGLDATCRVKTQSGLMIEEWYIVVD